MNILTLLTLVIQITLNANCLPFPAGQIVKYRVPTKYFNSTAQDSPGEAVDPLYNFLSQIHYGGSPTLNSNAIPSENISDEIVTVTSTLATTEGVTNESPEVTCVIQTSTEISNC